MSAFVMLGCRFHVVVITLLCSANNDVAASGKIATDRVARLASHYK